MTDPEIISYIRLRLGGVSEETISDATIQTFLTMRASQYPSSEPYKIYYTIQDCVQYLIAQASSQGNASRIYEQEKSVTVDVQGMDHVASWKKFLKDFLRDPQIEGVGGNGGVSVHIGGTSKETYKETRDNVDSLYKGWSVGRFFDDER